MKKPTDRTAFMDELRKAIDDSLTLKTSQYKRLYGKDYYDSLSGEKQAEYLKEMPEVISVEEYGEEKNAIELELTQYAGEIDDAVRIIRKADGKLLHWVEFENFKNKTAYFMNIAAWVVRYIEK